MNPNERQLEKRAGRGRIPTATYRLQFNGQFTFRDGTDLLDYLCELGISDAYASPLFQAAPASTHGYDTCDFTQLNADLGTRQDFETFSARRREHDLGLLLDMVPNHMGADLCNPWWRSVLEMGRHSPYAAFFDIDWHPLQSDQHDQVLLPILEDRYARVLKAGKFTLECEQGAFGIRYHDRLFPVAPHCYPDILERVADALEKVDAALASEVRAFVKQTHAELDQRTDIAQLTDRLKVRVGEWLRGARAFGAALESVVIAYAGRADQPGGFEALDALLRQQHYRLASWRVGPEEINYRRFFDVTQLVSLHMELPEVFRRTHELLLELVHSGHVTGLRIDHPDGLKDPKEYFCRLQQSFRSPLYVVVEKILSGDEKLRRDWPVQGTTGYDFLNQVNGIFVNRAHEPAFNALYRDFTGNTMDFDEAAYRGKKQILEQSLVGDVNALTQRLKSLSSRTREGQDYTVCEVRAALVEVLAALPVYRTYADGQSSELAPAERLFVEEAVARAKARSASAQEDMLNFLQDLLLLRSPSDFDDRARQAQREFVFRFQQSSGPATAKGLEDTAFYNYNRLLSLNEVGNDASRFGIDVGQFHAHNLHRAEAWPDTLLATATHDTKRGEDVRARLNALSELPREWRGAVERWAQLNRDQKTTLGADWAPHPNDEYLLYQTLVGAWPFSAQGNLETGAGLEAFRDRVIAYMEKATREAKARTSWTSPNLAYEKATAQFVAAILDPVRSGAFRDDCLRFVRRIAFFGQFNSLSQLLLKITSPGVPDFYQGTELWDLSLVDPDNRRPVDYPLRRQFLAELRQHRDAENGAARGALIERLLQRSHTGQVKLYVFHRALEFRNRTRHLYSKGQYVPLKVRGPKRDHVCAFARLHERQLAVTIVPRLVVGLTKGKEQPPLGEDVWLDSAVELPPFGQPVRFHNVLTGEPLSADPSVPSALLLKEVLGTFPVALLEATL